MTWTAHFSGHFAPWDEEAEKKVADVFRQVIDALQEYGVTDASFQGNFYFENYLIDKETGKWIYRPDPDEE